MRPEELRERTLLFAVGIIRFCRTLPKTTECRTISRQLVDASTAVAANYRASGRARSKAEFTAKMGVVVEEADESAGWLELLKRLEAGDRQKLAGLAQEAGELVAIFASSYNTAKNQKRYRVSNGRLVHRATDRAR